MSRIAPASGYVGGTKNQYRRDVWANFRDACKRHGWSRAESHALLMPSSEGAEIDVALANGFRQDHLHVVDREKAIVATLKKRYPFINTYGVSVRRAAERIRDDGVELRFANLDLCGKISLETVAELLHFGKAMCMSPHSYVAVNMLRGREQHRFVEAYQGGHEIDQVLQGIATFQLRSTDIARVVIALSALCGTRADESSAADHSVGIPVRLSRYRSTAGSQTMLWFVLEYIHKSVFKKPAAHHTPPRLH